MTSPTHRASIPASTRDEVLREAGYMCGNPRCRHILTLELHHIVWVKDGGGNAPTNLLVLCPNCHSLHTHGHIPDTAIRHWKGILHALNHAFNKESMDLLLYLNQPTLENIWYTGDGFLHFSGLVAAGLVEIAEYQFSVGGRYGASPPVSPPTSAVRVKLSDKGKLLVDAWLRGDEEMYRQALQVSQKPEVTQAQGS